jgi:DNA-binding transcriptional LysR family regulator
MLTAGAPTLDQLNVLLVVHDAGSFAAAARRLNRATSAVTACAAERNRKPA